MMKSRLFLTVILFSGLSCVHLHAQQVVGATGGTIVGTSYTLSYTVGEVATQTYSGGGFILNQGFQQPTYTITAIEDNLSSVVLAVFPNPTTGGISLEVKESQGMLLSYILYDFNGRELLRGDGKSGPYVKFDLDLSSFSQGVYMLKVICENQIIKVIKVVKN